MVSAVERMLLPGTDPLEVAAASETVIAWAHARQLEALQQVAGEQPEYLDPNGEPVDPAPAEVATTLAWSTGTAARRLDLATEVCAELPDLLSALRTGEVDLPKVQEIVLGTCELDPSDRVPLARQAVAYAHDHTRGQLRAWLDRRVAAIDPEAVQRRRKEAVRKRRVWLDPERDGMATIGAYLTAEQAQACWNALMVGSANVEGGQDAARADAFVARLTGLELGQPVPVQVIVTPTGPEIAGHGPISPSQAEELADNPCPSDRPQPSTGYRPAPRLVQWVRARDRHCRFPGCRRPAAACDLDHVIPYPAGATHESNLAALCRYHHRLKTHTPWKVRILDGAALEWTSPHGRVFHTSLEDP